jgi:hypothetical protein
MRIFLRVLKTPALPETRACSPRKIVIVTCSIVSVSIFGHGKSETLDGTGLDIPGLTGR